MTKDQAPGGWLTARCSLLAVIIATAVIVISLNACGEGSKTSDSSVANGARPSTTTNVVRRGGISHTYAQHSSEEREVYRAAVGLYQALEVVRRGGRRESMGAVSLCKLMNSQTQAQMIGAAEVRSRMGGKRNCQNAIVFLLTQAKQDNSLFGEGQKVIAVDVTGGTATATVRAKNGSTSHLALIKEDGRWKVAVL